MGGFLIRLTCQSKTGKRKKLDFFVNFQNHLKKKKKEPCPEFCVLVKKSGASIVVPAVRSMRQYVAYAR
jgi:hypothetical protein